MVIPILPQKQKQSRQGLAIAEDSLFVSECASVPSMLASDGQTRIPSGAPLCCLGVTHMRDKGARQASAKLKSCEA